MSFNKFMTIGKVRQHAKLSGMHTAGTKVIISGSKKDVSVNIDTYVRSGMKANQINKWLDILSWIIKEA